METEQLKPISGMENNFIIYKEGAVVESIAIRIQLYKEAVLPIKNLAHNLFEIIYIVQGEERKVVWSIDSTALDLLANFEKETFIEYQNTVILSLPFNGIFCDPTTELVCIPRKIESLEVKIEPIVTYRYNRLNQPIVASHYNTFVYPIKDAKVEDGVYVFEMETEKKVDTILFAMRRKGFYSQYEDIIDKIQIDDVNIHPNYTRIVYPFKNAQRIGKEPVHMCPINSSVLKIKLKLNTDKMDKMDDYEFVVVF